MPQFEDYSEFQMFWLLTLFKKSYRFPPAVSGVNQPCFPVERKWAIQTESRTIHWEELQLLPIFLIHKIEAQSCLTQLFQGLSEAYISNAWWIQMFLHCGGVTALGILCKWKIWGENACSIPSPLSPRDQQHSAPWSIKINQNSKYRFCWMALTFTTL